MLSSATEQRVRAERAEKTIKQGKKHLSRALDGFAAYPPDSNYQRGYLAALQWAAMHVLVVPHTAPKVRARPEGVNACKRPLKLAV